MCSGHDANNFTAMLQTDLFRARPQTGMLKARLIDPPEFVLAKRRFTMFGHSMYQNHVASHLAEQHHSELIERAGRERMIKASREGDQEVKSIAGGRLLRSILAALWLLIGRAS
jgi:hypothetical protein